MQQLYLFWQICSFDKKIPVYNNGMICLIESFELDIDNNTLLLCQKWSLILWQYIIIVCMANTQHSKCMVVNDLVKVKGNCGFVVLILMLSAYSHYFTFTCIHAIAWYCDVTISFMIISVIHTRFHLNLVWIQWDYMVMLLINLYHLLLPSVNYL